MAITNAQQARQLYKNGGTMEDISFSIVKPSKDGKRPGYFSGEYGGGAGDRGGDPRGSREENERAGRTDEGNRQRAEDYRRQQNQTNIPKPKPKVTKPKPKPKPTTTFNGKKYVVGSAELKNAIKAKAVADKKAKDLSNVGKSKTTKFGTVAKNIFDKTLLGRGLNKFKKFSSNLQKQNYMQKILGLPKILLLKKILNLKELIS